MAGRVGELTEPTVGLSEYFSYRDLNPLVMNKDGELKENPVQWRARIKVRLILGNGSCLAVMLGNTHV